MTGTFCAVAITVIATASASAQPDAASAPPAAPTSELAGAADEGSAAASAPVVPSDVAGDEVIVVTGTRSESPLAASPVITEVIDRKRLEESGAQTVAEALSLRPGLWLDRGVAGTTGITIQGLGPQYSLILVDGARQIGRTDGYLDLERFGLADIDHIEIVRGPSSALYGADALGGVVNIITRTPKDSLAIDAVGQLDGRLGSDVRGRISGGLDSIAAALSGEYRQGPAIKREANTEATTLDSYDTRHVGLRVTDRRADTWRFDGSADYLYQDLRGVDVQATGAVLDRQNLIETASAQLAGRYHGDKTALQLQADASLYRDQYFYDQRRSDALDSYEETKENLVEGSAQVVRDLAQHRVALGGELLREALDSDRLSNQGARHRGALFAQDEWRLGGAGGDAVIVVPAVRGDFDSQFGNHATPRLAARWQATPSVVVRASVGTGYRAPSFKELLLHFENPSVGYVVDGNPDLEPETSRSGQGGVEWQAQPWLWLSASGYYNSLRNLITAVTAPSDGSDMLRFSYGNIGRARTAGLDANAMLTRGRVGLELGYALTRARDRDEERALEGIPQNRFTVALRWRDPGQRLDAFASATMTGHRPYYLSADPQMATLTDRRLEVRARVGKRFANGLGGFLGVDNALDAGDADLDRIPPRTFYAGVELHR